jgi:hypothetical protein
MTPRSGAIRPCPGSPSTGSAERAPATRPGSVLHRRPGLVCISSGDAEAYDHRS